MKLCLLNQKGGVGKSTVGISLAWELARRGRRILVADGDVNGMCVQAAAVAERNGAAHPRVIRFRVGWRPPENLEDLLIDTPAGGEHGLTELHREALRLADLVVVPVSPGLDVWALERTIDLVRATPGVRGFLLVSQKDASELGDALRGVLRGHGLEILRSEVSYGQTWRKAPLAGLGVTQYRPHSPAAAELRELLAELERKGRS